MRVRSGWLADRESDACFFGICNDVRRHVQSPVLGEMGSFGHPGFLDFSQVAWSRFLAIMTLLVASFRGDSWRANASVTSGLRGAKLRVCSLPNFGRTIPFTSRKQPTIVGSTWSLQRTYSPVNQSSEIERI